MEEESLMEINCDNSQTGGAELKEHKLGDAEEKTAKDQEILAKTEVKEEEDAGLVDGEEKICASDQDQPQTELQQTEGDSDQAGQGEDNASEKVSENEDKPTETENTDLERGCQVETDTNCETEKEEKKKTDEKEENKPNQTEKKQKEEVAERAEEKKHCKGKDTEVEKRVKPEEAKKQRKSGLSSTPTALTRPRASARSSRASSKKDIIAKFQQDAPETPVARNFKLQKSATAGSTGASIKQKMLQWCCKKTRKYEGVMIENFSSSWCDGMAFCALIHHFFPDAFDFSSLNPKERKKNFTLAFKTAESLADCYPLLDVSDMLMMGNNPDPMCVFTYVQSLCHSLSKIEKERKDKAEKEKADKDKEAEPQETPEGTGAESGPSESPQETQDDPKNEEGTSNEEEDSSKSCETEEDGGVLVATASWENRPIKKVNDQSKRIVKLL